MQNNKLIALTPQESKKSNLYERMQNNKLIALTPQESKKSNL